MMPALLFFLGFVAIPGQVTTADYVAKWETIPRPYVVPQVPPQNTPENPQGGGAGSRLNAWANGTRPAGTFEIAYAVAGEDFRLSPLSPVVTIKAAVRDWGIVVRTPGLDRNIRGCGTCWFFRPFGSSEAWKVLGTELNAQWPFQATKPFVPLAGWDHALRGIPLFPAMPGWATYGAPGLETDPAATAPPVPSVTVQDVTNEAFEFAYSWACNDGESPLSDPVTVPAFVHPYDPSYRGSDFHSPFNINRKCIPPQGATGMFVYLRKKGQNVWNRQPCPYRDNFYLWDLDLGVIPISRYVVSRIVPSTVPGRSYLSPLQQAMRDTDANVIIDGDQWTCSPIISAYDGTAYDPPKGGQKFRRTIATPGGGDWILHDFVPPAPPGGWNVPNGPGTGWPMWVENSQRTKLVGCRMRPGLADTGIAFLDHSGGGAFAFQGRDLEFEVDWWQTSFITYGVRVLAGSGPQLTDHTASEPHFRDGHFVAKFPVVVEGNQSANWIFEFTEAVATYDVDAAVITAANSGRITFAGRLNAEGGRCLIAARSVKSVQISEIWIDQGMPAWACASGNQFPELRITGNQVNQWSGWIHPIEAPAGTITGGATLRTLWLDSMGGAIDARMISPRAGWIKYDNGGYTVPLLKNLTGFSPLSSISP